MNGYNFTERVRKVLMMAREEAGELHHEYVGTEHMLLGLCAEGEGVAAAALQNLDVDSEEIRASVLQTVKPGKADGTANTLGTSSGGILGAIRDSMGMSGRSADLPYTSRAKKVLELAMSEARDLGHSYVGTEHLLLGLMREERGIAAQVLTSMGLTTDRLRTEVIRLIGTEAPPRAGFAKGSSETQATIMLVVEHPDGRVEAKKFRTSNDAVRFLNGLEY